jgi:pSer/pThr/pTyr-binding forkhead associated (FHA) protein
MEEIREVLKARQQAKTKDVPAESDTTPFRPFRRPPLALLCILDDGRDDGEWVRLRGDRVVIGRTEGDIRIPHDNMISSRHAELTRQSEGGRPRWYLTDLQSTNGTYVRAGSALLKHGQELLIGSRRYRFDTTPPGGSQTADEGEEKPRGTAGWESISTVDLFPSLIELTAKGDGQRFLLDRADNWIGRDATKCGVVIANDPLVSPQHCRIYRDPRSRWHVENAKSLNGIWLRMEHMALDAACQFQLGEQRFLLKVL